MKTKISFIIVVLFLCSFQKGKLVKTKVNDAITIFLPRDFTPMSSADIEREFQSAKLPVAEYTDFGRTVELGINVAYSQWNPEDLEIMRSFYKSNILGLYDEVQFLREDVEEINGYQYAIFEFISSVSGDDDSVNQNPINKYTRIQYTIVRGKTVLFNFTAPASKRDKWQPISEEILQSVKISKTL